MDALVIAFRSTEIFNETKPFLLFYLQHQYPHSMNDGPACYVEEQLKGNDDVVYNALCEMEEVSVSFHYVYRSRDYFDSDAWVLPQDAELESTGDQIEEHLEDLLGGIGVDKLEESSVRKVVFEPKNTRASFHYLHYGNQAHIATRYTSICMIAAAPGHKIEEILPEPETKRNWW
ncbi:hypothetical protein DL93DRAFT_2117588 [Clavulina sp. PMI_390]|nr:hypothetical protein DL93DRAFT_2117588 [Clavulina sp. PMI_390]